MTTCESVKQTVLSFRGPHDTFHPLIREFLAYIGKWPSFYAPVPKHHSRRERGRSAVFAGWEILKGWSTWKSVLSVEVCKAQQPLTELLNKNAGWKKYQSLSPQNWDQRNQCRQQKRI